MRRQIQPEAVRCVRLSAVVEWLLLLAVTLPSVQPLIGDALPWTADGLLHFHRLAQMRRALGQGVIYPRWAPDMGFGFGFPLFNYYAPLSYLISLPLQWLGLSTQSTLQVSLILAVWVACVGAYSWGRSVFGRRAGWASAVCYVYSPYFLYNLYDRGALAEVWGLAWVPILFWASRRLVRFGRWSDIVLTGWSYAALILTHNILGLVTTPLLLLYIVGLWLLGERRPADLFRSAAVVIAGTGMAAFFWMPAIFEQSYVQIHRLYAPLALDFHNNFTSLAQLLQGPHPVDPLLINRPTPRSYGWVQLALAAWATASIWINKAGEKRSHVILLTVFVVCLTLVMLPISTVIWESLPLMRFVQFPWRFLGLGSLFLAMLAGAGAARLSGCRSVGLPLIVVGVTVYALTWLFPPYYPPQQEPTPLTLIEFELETGGLGTTSAGDYLPVWVQTLPSAESLLSLYEAAGPDAAIPRLELASLPEGARVHRADYGLTSVDIEIETPEDFQAIFNWYFFPGWSGRIDGQSLVLFPSGEHGLLGADVPAGRHHIAIHFGDTRLRRCATWVSIVSSGFLLLVAFALPSKRREAGDGRRQEVAIRRAALWCAGVALLLTIVKTVYLDSHENVFRRTRFDGESVAGLAHPTRVSFGDEMGLLGYELTTPSGASATSGLLSVNTDGVADLTLYWRVLRPLDTDYSVAVHLVDDQDRRYGQRDSQHPAGHPTSRWELDVYGYDEHRIEVWPGTPPGVYDLIVGVYDISTGRRLEPRDEGGPLAGTALKIASVEVVHSSRGVLSATPKMDVALNQPVGDGVQVVGLIRPPTTVDAGGRLPLTLFWRAQAAPQADYTARLRLVDPTGTSVAEERFVPGRSTYPTSAWQRGELVRDGRSFLVPATTSSGTYTLCVDLLDHEANAMAPSVPLVDVTVNAPLRTYAAPPFDYQAGAVFGGQAELLGFSLSEIRVRPRQEVNVTLVWRAQATTDTGYAVFVHLLDAAGNIVAQHDGTPADGSRPMTGWLPDEVIVDSHTIVLPPDAESGRYVLAVGLYDPITDDRLPVDTPYTDGLETRLLLNAEVEIARDG
ncbi:MAG: hypothetical protein GX620_13165 [Chloroflexi bacterium]|nr:hypothetical protein [Chloroflexota bacterium]